MNRFLPLLALAVLAVPVCGFGQQRLIDPLNSTADGIAHAIGSAPVNITFLLAQATTGGASRSQPAVNFGGRVGRPEIRVGDLWRYQVTDTLTNLTDAVSVEVTTVTGNRVHTRSSRSSSVAASPPTAAGIIDIWDRDWNQLSTGTIVYVPFYPALQFPLEPGKQWPGTAQWDSGSGILKHELRSQVTGWERVTVPAGSFDALRITVRGHISESASINYYSQSGSISNVIWYAPAVGRMVKKEINHIDSSPFPLGRLSERWELVEYKPD